MNTLGTGLVLNIDIGHLRRGARARQEMKETAPQLDQRSQREQAGFQPSRVVNTLREKGRMLNMVA